MTGFKTICKFAADLVKTHFVLSGFKKRVYQYLRQTDRRKAMWKKTHLAFNNKLLYTLARCIFEGAIQTAKRPKTFQSVTKNVHKTKSLGLEIHTPSRNVTEI